ncbi:DUF4199 domain-containing protein [Sinomicrobium oceani]|uniref:DUF4199 domain-containing protein n=1 Tax=Sinomicrobium oceani TaxID=1150368 RepID=UPI00227D5EF6|nr:DUF4199 domain-containing protein [Sinomicrobium oceani]
MEETQRPTTGKYALIYGLLTGAAGIAFSLMLHFMDMQYDQSASKQIISTLILIAFIILAIYQFKRANLSFISLSEALKIGIGASAVAAIVTILYLLIYINAIEPDFHEKLAEVTRNGMREQNPALTTEQIDNAIAMQSKFFWITYPVILVFNMFIGFVISLITGVILKKKAPEY